MVFQNYISESSHIYVFLLFHSTQLGHLGCPAQGHPQAKASRFCTARTQDLQVTGSTIFH